MASTLRRGALLVAVPVVVVLLFVGLLAFQPWRLVTDRVVDEQLPGTSEAAGAVVLARGELITHEHGTSGTAVVLRLPDGSRVLRLEDLDTSDGPLLRVWLSDQPVLPGEDGWYVFADGTHADLGDLAGNIGTSEYAIPADVDLDRLTSVSIWCARFSVSFGAAQLTPTAALPVAADTLRP